MKCRVTELKCCLFVKCCTCSYIRVSGIIVVFGGLPCNSTSGIKMSKKNVLFSFESLRAVFHLKVGSFHKCIVKHSNIYFVL